MENTIVRKRVMIASNPPETSVERTSCAEFIKTDEGGRVDIRAGGGAPRSIADNGGMSILAIDAVRERFPIEPTLELIGMGNGSRNRDLVSAMYPLIVDSTSWPGLSQRRSMTKLSTKKAQVHLLVRKALLQLLSCFCNAGLDSGQRMPPAKAVRRMNPVRTPPISTMARNGRPTRSILEKMFFSDPSDVELAPLMLFLPEKDLRLSILCVLCRSCPTKPTSNSVPEVKAHA